jgi:hypothetical protein
MYYRLLLLMMMEIAGCQYDDELKQQLLISHTL